MSKRRSLQSLNEDAIRYANEENGQQHLQLHHQNLGSTTSTPVLLNRVEGPLSYTLLNAGSATVSQHHAPSASNISQPANIQTVYHQESGAHNDKLSLLLAEGNMMSHSADGTATVADQIDKQYYVMLAPNTDQAGDKRAIPARAQYPQHVVEAGNSRQARRRELHNEVERRRRDNINSWMVQLSKILPDCVFGDGDNRSKALTATSKGAILEKAVAYIEALKAANNSLGKQVNETQQMKSENDILRRQIDALKAENNIVREQLERNGIRSVDSKFN